MTPWKTPSFNAADFFCGYPPGVWTVQGVTVFRYKYLDENTMLIHFQLENTTLSHMSEGTDVRSVCWRIPEGRKTRWNSTHFWFGSNNSTIRKGYIETGPNNTVIAPVLYSDESPFVDGSLSIYGHVTLELAPL